MSFWETQYIIQLLPSSQQNLQSPVAVASTSSSNDSKIPTFSFNKQGIIDKISLSLSCNHLFYEEKSHLGCVKALKIHLLGHEECEDKFLKYSDTVERLEFHGCVVEHVERCFRICSMMKKLVDARFMLGKVQPNNVRAPVKSQNWNIIENPKVTFLQVYTDIKSYQKQSPQTQKAINDCMEIILEYSSKQFRNVNQLRIDIPDTDNLLILTKNVVRSFHCLPKNPKLEVFVDSRICAKLERPSSNSKVPIINNLQESAVTSPDSAISNMTSSNTSYATIEAGKPHADKESNLQANLEAESVPVQRLKQSESNAYSGYEMSTVERLLRQNSIPADKKIIPVRNKREGKPIINPKSPKKSHMELEDQVSKPEKEINAEDKSETESLNIDERSKELNSDLPEIGENYSSAPPIRMISRFQPNPQAQDSRDVFENRRRFENGRESQNRRDSYSSYRNDEHSRARRSSSEYTSRREELRGFPNRRNFRGSRGNRARGSRGSQSYDGRKAY